MSKRRVNRISGSSESEPGAAGATVDLEVYQALMQQYNDLRQWVAQLEADLQAAHESQGPVIESTPPQTLEQVQKLRHDLQRSQERVAVMERACADRQQLLGDQEQQLILLQEETRILRERLEWHQRYAAQLKSALERCMETDRPPSVLPTPEAPDSAATTGDHSADSDWPSPRILPRRRTVSSVELPRFVRLS